MSGPNRGYGKSSTRDRGNRGDADKRDESPGSFEEFNENRSGGRVDGGSPNYEEAQSPNYPPSEYPTKRDLG